MKLKVGTKVTWTSRAAGIGKEKSGIIIARLPAESSLDKAMRDLRPQASRTAVKADSDQSVYDRYLVEVPRVKRGKTSSINDYYAPRASVVDKQMEARQLSASRDAGR
ncbi:hypothetical protein [Sorangium sp. So ce388]|uniref:hypothetical protein n=1 Tax=Sorangium sp. So ce388 TaxID=3133309 RepID=UPI003F5BB36A